MGSLHEVKENPTQNGDLTSTEHGNTLKINCTSCERVEFGKLESTKSTNNMQSKQGDTLALPYFTVQFIIFYSPVHQIICSMLRN